jgi:hypothetical protein
VICRVRVKRLEAARPAVCRALLLSAQSGEAGRSQEVNLRLLQLMTRDLLASRVPLH